MIHRRDRTSQPPWLAFAAAAGVTLGAAASAATTAQAAPDGSPSAAAAVLPVPAARERTCLVLSGGGARGAAHIGVLRVLQELHVPIDCVVGTSMGAIIGASWASGGTTAEMQAAIRDADWNQLLADRPVRQLRSLRSKELERAHLTGAELGLKGSRTLLPVGAVIGQQLDRFLESLLGAPQTRGSFDDLPVPFRAIATDIESGRMTVIGRGSVHAAARASMSVPGVFAPQEIDGHLLVDGGLVRNLGVDVARSLGATRIIAVNLGTPLSGREELGSLLGVTGQMINILTEQNVAASLAQLGPRDVLIQPQLGSFSAADFGRAWTTIDIGERAAREVESQLRELAVNAGEFAERERLRLAARFAPSERRSVRLQTEGLRVVNPESVRAVFDDALRGSTSDGAIRRAVDALYATDDFELVGTRIERHEGIDEIIVEPHEKAWGPNYLRPGLALSTDLGGASSFTLALDYRRTWLNRRGLEWHSTVSAGEVTGVRSELIQPIDVARRWLASGYIDAQQRVDEFFSGGNALSRLRDRVGRIGVEARRELSTTAELRLGVRRSRFDTAAVTGIEPPDLDGDTSEAYAGLLIDRLDNWDFPRRGTLLAADLTLASRVFSGDFVYRKADVRVMQAFGGGRHSFSVMLRHGSALGTDLPLFDAFDLGGFQNLSGFGDRQILANGITFGRLVYSYRIGESGPFTRGIYLGGSLEAASVHEPLNRTDTLRDVLASSLYVAADTAFGPFYLGTGFGEGGERTVYLFLGTPR